MVGEKFEICLFQRVKNVFKLSTMVGENFEIYFRVVHTVNTGKLCTPNQLRDIIAQGAHRIIHTEYLPLK